MGQRTIALLEEARDLLAHQIPDRDLAKVHERAMETLVKALRKQRRAATERPRAGAANSAGATDRAGECAGATARNGPTDRASAASSAGATDSADATTCASQASVSRTGASRYVPAALKRAVWERDQARCCYVDARGCRCRETSGLEIHHEQAFAKGGRMTLNNLALRCRPHNDLAAQQDFGREFIVRKKGQRRRRSSGRAEPVRQLTRATSRLE